MLMLNIWGILWENAKTLAVLLLTKGEEQACSNKVVEYSRTDILPTRSSSVAKGYNEAGLPNGFKYIK